METTLPTKPGTYKETIRSSFHLYRLSLAYALPLSLLLSFVVFIPRFFSLAIGQDIFAGVPFVNVNRLWLLVIELISLLLFISIIWRVHSFSKHKHEALKEDIVIGFKKVLAVFVATIIQGIAVLAVTLTVYAVQIILSTYQLLFTLHPIAIVLTGLLFVGQLFLIVYVYTLFIFLVPLITIENKGIVNALEKSVRLVWNQWWRTFSVQITPWISYLLLLVLIRYILHIDIHIYFLDTAHHSFFATLFHVLLFALFVPWIASTLLVQLKDLELRKKLTKK